MPKQVWKFQLPSPAFDEGWVMLPSGAKPLHVATQDGTPFLWAEVDPTAPQVRRSVMVYGTGWELPDEPGTYLGTFQVDWTVWHVYIDQEAAS